MRTQIAAANWKMNCTLQDAKNLLQEISENGPQLKDGQAVIIAVPFPYLLMAKESLASRNGYSAAAQNCHTKDSGAYTGEVSASMIASCGLRYVIIGHSERREYNQETDEVIATKVSQALKNGLVPIFCCGEPLEIRDSGTQNEFVARQVREGLFGLNADEISKIVLAYEPVWAIGTGKTATADQAQEMHQHIRKTVASQYGEEVANAIPVLYGGSVKGDNAAEIFGKPDVDGGLVGGASLKAAEFIKIIESLKA